MSKLNKYEDFIFNKIVRGFFIGLLFFIIMFYKFGSIGSGLLFYVFITIYIYIVFIEIKFQKELNKLRNDIKNLEYIIKKIKVK